MPPFAPQTPPPFNSEQLQPKTPRLRAARAPTQNPLPPQSAENHGALLRQPTAERQTTPHRRFQTQTPKPRKPCASRPDPRRWACPPDPPRFAAPAIASSSARAPLVSTPSVCQVSPRFRARWPPPLDLRRFQPKTPRLRAARAPTQNPLPPQSAENHGALLRQPTAERQTTPHRRFQPKTPKPRKPWASRPDPRRWACPPDPPRFAAPAIASSSARAPLVSAPSVCQGPPRFQGAMAYACRLGKVPTQNPPPAGGQPSDQAPQNHSFPIFFFTVRTEAVPRLQPP